MSALNNFLEIVENRRTIYNLKPELTAGVTIEDVQKTVQSIVKNTPTAFNSQPNRAIILTGEAHKSLWNTVAAAMPSDGAKMRPTSCRDEAYGSVIFFTDDKVTEKLQADFPAFADAFPQCAQHTTGAAQIMSWAAVEALGLGGHLQHYNGLVKGALPKDIPESWSVHSQLVFGARNGEPDNKTYIHNPIKIYN
ncbi:nitroreductase family protein NDAI_0A00630 [Naumovozyma dairenensis CBS 421]|uniref:Nitroreductase domain-containing protein n=1 Tax=Naumovozyma dairenensis (strain ATCC 10597 / BCRC 20456 / CBS 421 / NBRC 0211 / NRRL Y-12639) TaxID=1071378 RepID=G0W333_NAUDC|nr:hypothetical protein NDAI_0A00630 [Naumovozyma dairenensis CBS 421]CCD22221.1 hypothetical protein NDAI_0A00630 [Naumovozyma dairenensis CBS 421]